MKENIKVHLGIDERRMSASVTKEISKLEGDPLATKKIPKKSRTMPKKIQGGGYSLVRFCILRYVRFLSSLFGL